MFGCLLIFLATIAAVNWVANPYGAWRIAVVDRAYRDAPARTNEANERVTTAYRVRVEEPTTMLVGSSRVLLGMPVEESSPDVFNASLSGASLAEIAAVLQLAVANPRLRRVVWGVDFYTFDERFIGFRHPETRLRLEGDERRFMVLSVKETLLSMRALEDSREILLRAFGGRKKLPPPVPVPWPEELIRERLVQAGQAGLNGTDDALLKLQLTPWIANYSAYRLSEPQVSLMQRAVKTVEQSGAAIILFIPPLSSCELEAIEQTGQWQTFQHWKRELLAAGPYWDFSGYGKLERADSLFLDVPHFKPAVGQVILRRLLGEDCSQCGEMAGLIWDAGVLVDTTTVDQYLTRQDATRTDSMGRDHRCVGMVKEMLRAHGSDAAGR